MTSRKETRTMREIKFRAWDEKEKCRVSGFAIHQSGMFSDWAGCKKVNGQCIADANWQYPQEIPHIKIMQYTGLKDKNGREIYEGDIVKANLRFFDIVDQKCRVIFHNGSFGLQYGYSLDYFKSLATWDDIEVIGNIYEHPHLLKGEKNA